MALFAIFLILYVNLENKKQKLKPKIFKREKKDFDINRYTKISNDRYCIVYDTRLTKLVE